MGLGTSAGADQDLLGLVQRVAPLLALPLVLCAALSQFSAATAVTEASGGNLDELDLKGLGRRTTYLAVGAAAAVIAATVATAVIIVVASRAFAAYHALQCLVAARASEGGRPRGGLCGSRGRHGRHRAPGQAADVKRWRRRHTTLMRGAKFPH